MKAKKEIVILVLIIVGLLFYLWSRQSDQVNYELPSIESLTAGAVTRMELQRPNGTISLNKKNGSWIVGTSRTYPADKGRVDRILEAISGLRVSALASRSGTYARYSLDNASAIRVKAWEGDTLVRSFSIGKTASTRSNTYIALHGRPEIYLSEGNLRMTFDKNEETFRDKAVLSFPMQKVQSMTIVQGPRTLELEKTGKETEGGKQPAWTDGQGNEVSRSQAESLLNTLHSLQCRNYIQDRDKDDFAAPDLIIRVQAEGTHELNLFPRPLKGDGQAYPGTSSDSRYPFEISSYNGQDIVTAVNSLLGIESSPEDDDKGPSRN